MSQHNLTMSLFKIIGISGVTNGGKTTLCQKIAEYLRTQKVHVAEFNMDDYYYAENSEKHVMLSEYDYKCANWDDVCSVDWQLLLNDVNKWKLQENVKHPRVLLVDGIMIFNNAELVRHFDQKYYITLTKDICCQRRKDRHYEPPDPAGYFEKIAWPYYLKMKQEVDSMKDIVYMDGAKVQEDMFKEIMPTITSFLRLD